jgi:PKD repeat protein
VASGKAPSWSVVLAPDGVNAAPTASFTTSCTGLACSLDAAASSDVDGTVDAYAWDFGDGATGSGATASHTYAAAGDYPITLTVTDNDSATGQTAQAVSVAPVVVPPVAFRAGATSNRTATTSTVAIPATVQTGDALVLFVTANTATTVTAPSGWTLHGTVADGTPDLRSWLFTRTAPAGVGGTSVSVTLGQSSKVDMTVLAYANTAADPVTTFASAAEPASGATHASPAAEVAGDGSVVVSYWADKTSGTTSWAVAEPVTERTESLGSGLGQVSSTAGDTLGVAAGPWPGASATSSTSSGKAVAWTLVLAHAG